MRIPRTVRWTVSLAVGLGLASVAVVGLASPPNAATPEPLVVASVRDYVDQWTPERDPLVRLPNGIEVKASNYYGVKVDGTRYYYRLVHDQSFDPKSRGEAGQFEAVATLDAGTPFELEIYSWKGGPQDGPATLINRAP